MNANLESPRNTVDASRIIDEGRYYVLDDCALRDETYAKVTEAFHDGVEKFEGKDCRRNIEEHGLAKIHEYFPVEKVRLLEDYLLKRLRNDLYYWSYRVGREDLGLTGEFFLDHLIMIRIHYPFLVAKEGRNVINPPFPLMEKMRAGVADLGNLHMLAHRAKDFRRNKLGRWLNILDETNSYTPEAYHGKLPRPARAHSAHIDTWYGHSFDGINLWWAIDGVNEDNTVILYPEMFGKSVTYSPASMYLAPGIPLPKPVKLAMKPGQLLVFNPELLHSTQVNISDETRVALTTRLNPRQPRFNVNAGFHFQHWRSSEDLEKRNFSKIRVFPASQYPGKPSIPTNTEPMVQKTIRVQLTGKLTADTPLAVCESDVLPIREKMAVDCQNAKILIYRGDDGLRAFNRKCAHLGIDLIDGYHDEQHVYCPGHGVAYSLENGSSSCDAFNLQKFNAYDRDGYIYVEKAAASG